MNKHTLWSIGCTIAQLLVAVLLVLHYLNCMIYPAQSFREESLAVFGLAKTFAQLAAAAGLELALLLLYRKGIPGLVSRILSVFAALWSAYYWLYMIPEAVEASGVFRGMGRFTAQEAAGFRLFSWSSLGLSLLLVVMTCILMPILARIKRKVDAGAYPEGDTRLLPARHCRGAVWLVLGLLTVVSVFMPRFVNWYAEFRLLMPKSRIALLAAYYPCAIISAGALVCMLLLLNNIIAGDVFVSRNVKLIRLIQIACGAVSLITLPAAFLYLPLLFATVIMAFLCLVIGVVSSLMSAAVDLREENDLTI